MAQTWSDYLPDGTTFADIDRAFGDDCTTLDFECAFCEHENLDAEVEVRNARHGYGWATFDASAICERCDQLNEWEHEDIDESVLEDF